MGSPIIESIMPAALSQMDTKGIVVLRQILSLEQQLHLINIVERHGGLKDPDGKWNFIANRGRNFCNIDKYDLEDRKFLSDMLTNFKFAVEARDASLAFAPVTHVLTLCYPNAKGIAWHTDDYGGNNGDFLAPVYSLSLGNSCTFEYKLVGESTVNVLELHSGDLIVFGGCQREMFHTVSSVKKSSFRPRTDLDVRFNLTFRTCSNFTEEEEAYYQTHLYVQRLKEKWKVAPR
jgi:hypothetical protein